MRVPGFKAMYLMYWAQCTRCVYRPYTYEFNSVVLLWQKMVFLLVSLCVALGVLDAAVQCRGVTDRGVTDRALCHRGTAIAVQLSSQLSDELPRNDIDLRARLSDSGVREGKVIPYRRSEARVDALLDALCPSLSKHTIGLDGAWVVRVGEETPEHLHHARTLMNTCVDILHDEEDRISAWLMSDASEDPSPEAVSALICRGVCGDNEPADGEPADNEPVEPKPEL